MNLDPTTRLALEALRQYQRRITRWLIGLTLILGVLALIMVIWIVQWVDRFGWLW